MSNENQIEHGKRILGITHAVICGCSLEEAEVAFGTLCREDLEAAVHLADILVLASPDSAPIWTAIMEHMAKEHPNESLGDPCDADRQAGPAMSDDDTRDTAGGLAEHMGWLDVDKGDKS